MSDSWRCVPVARGSKNALWVVERWGFNGWWSVRAFSHRDMAEQYMEQMIVESRRVARTQEKDEENPFDVGI